MRRYLIWIGLLFCFIPLMMSCAALEAVSDQGTTPTSKIKTIHPATLTAIYKSAPTTPTVEATISSGTLEKIEGTEISINYGNQNLTHQQDLATIVAKFNTENPWDIKVELISLESIPTKTVAPETDSSSQTFPVVILGEPSDLWGWEKNQKLVDLNQFIADPKVGWENQILDDIYPPLIETFSTEEGKLVGLPFSQSVQVMFYNRSWAEELGFLEPPQTSGELREQVCAAAQDYQTHHPSAQKGRGGMMLYPTAENITAWVAAYGGIVFDPKLDTYTFTNATVKTIAREWWLLKYRGCGFSVAQAPNPLLQESIFDPFNDREALIMMGPAEAYTQIHIPAGARDLSDSWSMIPFLGPQGEMAVISNIQAAGILSSSAEEELAAWLFLDFLLSSEIQAEWVIESGQYPIRKSTLALLEEHQRSHSNWAQGIDMLPYIQAQPQTSSWIAIHTVLGDAFAAVLNGGYKTIVQQLEELDMIAEELHTEAWK